MITWIGVRPLEFLRPLKNIRELGKSMYEMDPQGVVKNYIESVPGMMALQAGIKPLTFALAKSLIPKMGTDMALKTAARLGSATWKGLDWYLQPARGLVSKTAGAVKGAASSVIAQGAVLPLAGATALATVAHVMPRLTRRAVSPFDIYYAMSIGKPTKFHQEMMDKKFTWKDWLLGNPLSVYAMKAIYTVKGQRNYGKERKE